MRGHYRIGFVIDGKLPGINACIKKQCSPKELFFGWPTESATTIMRFGWVADFVNISRLHNLTYELYRPWRRYEAVVFLKSMSEECLQKAKALKRKNVRTFFDINVDYLTPAAGRFYYDGMAPSEAQRVRSRDMCLHCDAVLCASQHIAAVASEYNEKVFWLPDNVRDDLIVSDAAWRPRAGKKIPLLWSGQAAKMFELLRIKDVLLAFADRVHLKIITNSLAAVQKWYEPYAGEFQDLLEGISHEIIPFTTLEALMDVYSEGGICISPRFLDNTYNRGHSEWKITLPLARGCVVVTSDQVSYIDVANRARPNSVIIAQTDQDWVDAFNTVCSEDFPWDDAASGATQVVREYYASSIIARRHAAIIKSMVKDEGLIDPSSIKG